MRGHRFLILSLGAACAVSAASPAAAQGTVIGFPEEFALAADRAAALEQLIPGTEDYYYYTCLHQQNRGALAEVESLLGPWVRRYGRTARVEEIENRQALLAYRDDPRATLELLRQRLDLRFDHQRQVPGAKPDLPTRLDPSWISRATLTRRAFELHPKTLDGFRDPAFEYLVASDLDADLLQSLLQRLARPDLPNLPALVVRNLDHPQSGGFGSLTIHKNLLLDQLEQCVALRPSLLGESAFVETFLRRLHPGPDVDWRRDAEARQAYLERLESFVRRLPPSQNSLKAHVLYHRLAHDRSRGVHERDRFLEFLRLPRTSVWSDRKYLEGRPRGEQVVDLSRAHGTGLPAVQDDEPLVRELLMHFFQSEDSYQPYAEFIQDRYLRQVFAETRILYGRGDREQWYSLLDDPAAFEALRERVEIEFAPTQRTHFGANDPVAIDVDLKNVGTLLLKIFEINTFNYYAERGREVDASIKLDGLVANEETTHTFDESPLQRVRRRFDLPTLARPGVYVVELIGNGLSSRAVIHKGRLQMRERVGAAGHVVRVLEESGRHLKDASVWMSGHEYRADERGEIALPYSTDPGPKSLILRHAGRASLVEFNHLAETYELHAAIYLDRESLLSRHTARILVRPTLLVNGRPASLELLEDRVLTIVSRDVEGISSTRQVRDVELSADRESTHEIEVPADLSALTVRLEGKVRVLSRGETIDLAGSPRTFSVNAIDDTPLTSCPVLGRTDQGYVLDVLGKSGEPKPDRAVTLTLSHRDFSDPLDVTLKTDTAGRIHLGELDGVLSVRASGFLGAVGGWDLRTETRTWPDRIHGVVGRALRVPYQGRASRLSREVASLLELRAGAFTRDRFAHLALADGFLELRDLPAGEYSLWLKEADRAIPVRVADGEISDGWILGRDRMLPVEDAEPLHVTEVAVTDELVEIALAHAGEDARVHVVATRYLPAFDPFQSMLSPDTERAPIVALERPASLYRSGREIGDEYRYILERRYATKYPGNMLRRPGLLLNPWALEETETFLGRELNDVIGAGGGAGGGFGGKYGRRGAGKGSGSSRHPGSFPNLDFLPDPSVVLANLRPDAAGVVRVRRAELGAGSMVHILALDRDSTVYTSRAVPEVPLVPADLGLSPGLDPERHFTERRAIELLDRGATAAIEDVTTAGAEVYDSLDSVFRLFQTLSGDADLDRFAFILGWPDLTLDEKRQLYSAHACHELHLFLQRKDPAFFEQVVRPYLANKMHKTFLDRWLLDEDLSAELDPWAFAQLNVVERILLAQRQAGQADRVVRHVQDLWELLPPDAEGERRRFETALGGRALDMHRGLGEVLGTSRERFAEDPRKLLEHKAELEVPVLMPEQVAESDNLDRRRNRGAELEITDLELRADFRSLYRQVEPTREQVEHNYWHRRIDEQDGDLIRVNGFWSDFAGSRGARPFFSSHLAEATGSFAEMMLALALLDLPFRPGEHSLTTEGTRLQLEAASPLLLVRKELQEADLATERPPLLISQHFFRLDDRVGFEGNQRREKHVTEEFLVDVVYGCQVVLTNPTSTDQAVRVLLQIPRGAIPVQKGFATRSIDVPLDAHATRTLEYLFYFPHPGPFVHHPVHVSSHGDLVAFAEPLRARVLEEPSRVDKTSWEHLSQSGSENEVLAYLDSVNLRRVDLTKIAWRMRARPFFARALTLLRDRHHYDDTLWSYGIHHGDEDTIREYLRHASGFLDRCGRFLVSPLVTIDPVERRAYQHVEFEPLVNPRAHRPGRRPEILNQGLARQYLSLLDILAFRPQLDDTDWMSVTCYLLLQDRVEEALASFAKVDPGALPMRLQYDYLCAYLDFFSERPGVARTIAQQYQDHPVERWRNRFRDVLAQLDEAEGVTFVAADADDRMQQQTALSASEPQLELMVEARQVTIQHQNLERCEVRYYEMDIEFLFSTSPFLQQGSGSFAYIRPNRSDTFSLTTMGGATTVDLPAEFQSSNVLVEVRGGGLTRRQACYAHRLSVQTFENYGQLRVTHAESDNPLSKVYVKVYARTSDGGTRFHKDGYTDLRGRFDYASLSGEGREPAERYAILVFSETDGAVIREVAAPLQ